MFYKMVLNLCKSCPPEYQELCPVHLESQVAHILCFGCSAYSFSPLSVPVTNLREQAADRMAHHPSTLQSIFPLLNSQQTASHMRKSALVQTDYRTIPSWHCKFHQQSHQCLSFLTQKTWVPLSCHSLQNPSVLNSYCS